MSYINENCVYAGVCVEHACACKLWGEEFNQEIYDSLKKEYDEAWEELKEQVHYSDEDGWTI